MSEQSKQTIYLVITVQLYYALEERLP